MAPFKARGRWIYYQHMWDTVGGALCHFALQFMETGCFLDGSNDTILVLIPKIDQPEQVSHFRPISLCNVNDKMITKALTNQLREIIGVPIAPTENSSVTGR